MSLILLLVISVSFQTHAENYFKDVSAGSGLESYSSTTTSFGDYDNDGRADLLVSGKLFKNTSTGEKISFQNITEDVGLQEMKGHPMFADINNDGQLDILTQGGQIFLQKKGRFLNFTNALGLSESTELMTLSVGDFNRDGWVDIFYGAAEKHTNDNFLHFPPKLYLNLRGEKFIDVSASWNLSQYPGYTRGITWVDYNNDSQLDVYLSNYRLLPNFLFENQKGIFKERSGDLGVRGEYDPTRFYDQKMKQNYGPRWGHTIGSTWADFNNDGFLDLWVSNLVHKFVGHSEGYYDIRGYVCDDSKIYKNVLGQKFVDMRASSEIPLKPRGDWSVYKGDELWSHSTGADIDNDGLVDMYVPQIYDLSYAHSLLFKNLGNFKFKEISAVDNIRVIDSYSGAFADLDGDGRQDLIVSGRPAVGKPPAIRVFKNIVQNRNQFIKFRLLGKESSTFPVGTQVPLRVEGGQTLVRQFEGNTGTLNQQNEHLLHFGLGLNPKILNAEVVWPSGKRYTLGPDLLKLNQINELRE